MKKTMKKLVALIPVLAFAASALAQVDPDPNCCGIYFDQGATQNCFMSTTPFQTVTAYICVTNLTEQSGISGWECDLEIIGGGLVAPGWVVHWNGTIFFLPMPPFAVGIGTAHPAPWSPSIVLATMTAYAVSPTIGAEFRIVASPAPSVPGHNGMVVAAGNDETLLIPIHNSTGYDSQGVPNICAAINSPGPCPVPNETSSWGGVKALFE